MTTKFDEATLRVSASYGLKVPTDVDYSPEDAHISFSTEVPVEDVDVTQIEDLAQQIRLKLMEGVKLAVLEELRVPFKETATGGIEPDLSKFAGSRTPPQPSSQGSTGTKTSYNKPQGGGGKGNLNAMPKYQVTTADGKQVTLIDQRPLKEDGTYKTGAADFKVDGERQSFWLKGRDGTFNTDVVEWLQSQGIEV